MTNPFQARSSAKGTSAFANTFKDSDVELHRALAKQDSQLDELADVVLDLKGIALTQGAAAEEDITTLKRIADKTDNAKAHIDTTNNRVRKLL
jgi:uncharacterized protein YukE